MHLVRVTRIRKYCPDKTYLYIRLHSRPYYDFPLGRIDTRRPERIVESWLEDSSAMPELLKKYYTLRIRDVITLWEAILNGYPWFKPDWLVLRDTPQEWKCRVIGNRLMVLKEILNEKSYTDTLAGWRERFPEKFKGPPLLVNYLDKILNAPEIMRYQKKAAQPHDS